MDNVTGIRVVFAGGRGGQTCPGVLTEFLGNGLFRADVLQPLDLIPR